MKGIGLDLSIIIASFNTREMTLDCLRTIKRMTKDVAYEVIVVDNASVDGSADAIAAEFPEVLLVRNGRNVGFAPAQNIGLKLGKGRNLLILNSDILLLDNAFKVMVDYLDRAGDEVGVLGPQILNPDMSVAPSARRATLGKAMVCLSVVNYHFPIRKWLPDRWFARLGLRRLLSRFHDNYKDHSVPCSAEYIDGMCMLVKRCVLEKVGLFDEQFFFDSEVIDLSIRIRQAGWRIDFSPAARVVHVGHHSRKKLSGIVVETHRSCLVFNAKHYPDRVAILRRTTILTARARRCWLRLCRTCSGAGSRDDYDRQMAVCDDIIAMSAAFDPAHASGPGVRIPTLAAVS
jgi:GT2 family glycosyltransferase